ncbi:MAG: ATP-dependent RNA helicase HrpA, partial [Acidimicrobiales bacterium]
DGILLAEIQRDRKLSKYDTLIIDEAHERSLNIDFILGYLRQLLPQRPDLKVIVTSATIDTERFSEHFSGAPIIEVSGRTYPVDIRYEPIDGPEVEEARSQQDAICETVRKLQREGPGDMLVFLAGERDIRETADALTDLSLPNTEVFPLYARLSSAEQHRVFKPHTGRRVVLATNVAETSVTVPGIRYVIDPGNARMSRYNRRTKVQRLPIEEVSQASADQRAGRCGRIGPGICVRLYSEDDYNTREEFTEPEIKRTNLASVILQMASLGLGDISGFPFVEPPDERSISDGVQLLEELDALDPEYHGTKRWLTPMGRELAKLPVDPRFGRMIIEATDNGVLDEVTIIVAGLSVQDPRERPSDNQQAADESHRRFVDDTSDFMTLLNLWRYVQAERKKLSSGQYRRMCRREFLNYNRVREWQDIHKQLGQTAKELGYRRNSNTLGEKELPIAVHRSVLAGLLSHIGMKDVKGKKDAKRNSGGQRDQGRRQPRAEYIGARNARFAIAPGSALTKQAPAWVMAAELVETNRMWGRMAAPIDPNWAEDLAAYLVTRSYTDPTWDASHGVAHTTERVTLYGLPLANNRRITVGSVNEELGRELFIHHALVEDEWETDHDFVRHNRQVIDEVQELEARTRRRDLLVEQRIRHDFFEARIPPHVTSAKHFNKWWRKVQVKTPELLRLSPTDLLADDAAAIDSDAFPDVWHHGDAELELAYQFDTSSHVDGVSVHVPIEVLNQLDPQPFEWSVPGMRMELVSSLVRSLPKATRKALMPINETVEALLPELDPNDGGLYESVRHHLGRRAGVSIPRDGFDLDRVPQHLRPTFRVINDQLEVLAEGKDLVALQELMADRVKSELAELASASDSDIQRSGLRTWDFGDLPREIETPGPSHTIRAFPALVDEQDSVAIRLFADRSEQEDAMWTGTRRLIRLHLPSPAKKLDKLLSNRTKLHLATAPVQSRAQWYNDCIDATIDDAIAVSGGPVWDEASFAKLVERTTQLVPAHLERLAGAMSSMVETLSTIEPALAKLSGSSMEVSVRDVRAHLARLTYPGFLAGVGVDRVDDVARYLQAISHRVDALPESPTRDLSSAATCVEVEQRHARMLDELGHIPELEEVTWMLEELRVNTFAQHLKVPGKISATRVDRKLSEVARQYS